MRNDRYTLSYLSGCHSRVGGNPEVFVLFQVITLDPRLRGDDEEGEKRG